jgi:hypothetical protein
LRSLDQQERELAELRPRTNTTSTAAALIASFLGGAAAIRQHNGFGELTILALVVLAVADGNPVSVRHVVGSLAGEAGMSGKTKRPGQ